MPCSAERNRLNLEAKFIICPFGLPLEQPKSPAARTASSPGVCPSTAKPPPSVLVPLCRTGSLGAAGPPGTDQRGCTGSTVTWSSGPFHTTESKIMVIFSERDFLNVLLWTQAQLAHQMDTRVREQAYEVAGGDQKCERPTNAVSGDTDYLRKGPEQGGSETWRTNTAGSLKQ